MADLAFIRTRLAVNAATIAGLETYAYMPDQVAVGPAGALIIGVDPGDVVAEYDQTYAGSVLIRLRGRLYLAAVADQEAQARLDEYLSDTGTRSLKSALESDRRLAGAADNVIVRAASGYGEHEVGEARYIGAEVAIEVWAR